MFTFHQGFRETPLFPDAKVFLGLQFDVEHMPRAELTHTELLDWKECMMFTDDANRFPLKYAVNESLGLSISCPLYKTDDTDKVVQIPFDSSVMHCKIGEPNKDLVSSMTHFYQRSTQEIKAKFATHF